METEHHQRRAASSPTYLPPLELLPSVKLVNNKYRTTDKIETPTDEHNVPQPTAILRRLGELMIYDEPYAHSIDLRIRNAHHHAYTRRKYSVFGERSFQLEYREGPSLKTEMYIPFHNLEHLVGIETPIPDDYVMRERAREQKLTKHLYEIARTALWLDSIVGTGQSAYRTAETYLDRHHMPEDAYVRLPSHSTFLRTLETIQPGTMGVLPSIDELASADLNDAVNILAECVESDVSMSAEESTHIIFEASRLSGVHHSTKL